jgi:hypothetical protein
VGQFVLQALDHAGALDRRLATRAAHLDWVAQTTELKVLAAGPLLTDGGEFLGSLFIVDARARPVRCSRRVRQG